jgi:DNA-binding transcriptional ArsR family regulator
MTAFDPNPPDRSVGDIRQRWLDETDTFGRVYDAILGITEPTPYPEIAEIADCAPNTAKKHVERLREMGIVRADRDSRPARYERNDGYLEWQETNRLAEALTVDEIIERVQWLEARRAELETRFGTTDPASVSVFDQDDHHAIHERMDAVSEWQAIDRDIRRYELARQLAQHDGRLLPA